MTPETSQKGLKLKQIKFNNHVAHENMKCEFNGSYTELWGLNGSGKTTIINGLWIALQGIAARGKNCLIGERWRFFSPGKKSMDVKITLIDERHNNAEIIIQRHITKASNGKILFKAPDNYPISQEWLEGLLSVAFLSAKNFTQKTAKEQALLLGINTNEYDDTLKELKSEYTSLNREYKKLCGIEVVEKVEQVDIDALSLERDTQQKLVNQQYKDNQVHNAKLRKQQDADKIKLQEKAQIFNGQQEIITKRVNTAQVSLDDLKRCGYDGSEVKEWIGGLPLPEPEKDWRNIALPDPAYIDEMPNTSAINELDAKILTAQSTNEKAAQYQKYLKKLTAKDDLMIELTDNKKSQDTTQTSRLKYIKTHDCQFDGLEIDDNGGLTLKGREIREPYFSKGELEKIVAGLRASLDDELKIIFIDDFDLLDEKNQKELPEYLIERGFQVIVAKVGRSAPGENIITLSSLEEEHKPVLI